MSNETTVKNDAGNATSCDESTRALTGKIAQLPKDVREELNCRLDDGQPASETLPWLNGLPAVKKILDKHFSGRPINERNLSLWRHNGYERWLKRQEALAEFKELAEDAEDLFVAASGKVARIAVAKMVKQLQSIPAEQASVNELTKISHAISALLNTDQNQARLEFEKTRVFQGNERLVLSWDKFLRDRVATAQRALEDAICKDIQAADIDNGEKIELLGHELFGKKWHGRKVPVKKEAPKQEPEGSKKEPAENADVKKTEGQTASAVKNEEKGPIEKTEVGSPIKGEPTADQQVRPTMVQGHNTEAAVSPVKERAEELKISGGLTTAATTAEMKKTGMNITGNLTTAATVPVVAPNPKQKPMVPQRELSPYDKALLEGKTHLEAMYAQFTPVKNAQPKPQEDPSVPKPSPWDAFSEPVKTSPLASFRGTMRPSSLG